MVGEEVREEAGMREWGDGRKKHVTPRGVLCNLDAHASRCAVQS